MSTISGLTSPSSSSNSNSSSSTTNIYNGHIFGLASGLDVDSMVTGMTTDVQQQIDQANQKKQTLQWQQTDYQTVVTALNTFNSAYLALSGSGSITGNNALQTYMASSDNPAVTAVAQQGATGTPRSMTVYQNATTAAITTSSANNVITGQVDLTNSSNVTALEGNAFNFTVDGVTKSITLTASDVSTNGGDVAKALQGEINSAFGWDSSAASANGPRVTVSLNSSGYAVFSPGAYTDASGNSTTYNTAFTVSGLTTTDSTGNITTNTTGLNALTGSTSAANNRLNRNLTVAQLLSNAGVTLDSSSQYSVQINGQSVTLNGSDSIFKALQTINAAGTGVTLAYSSTTGAMTATASSSGAASNFSLGSGAATDPTTSNDISTAFLGALGFSAAQASGETTAAMQGNAVTGVTGGQDALFSIDGGNTRMARSSNSFTLDNVNYTINGTVSGATTAKISFTQDTSTAVKSVQGFVTAYNVLLATITTYTNTKPDADYKPLTDSQKSSMSDTDIANWNAKASAGVLFNDDTLNGLQQQLRDMISASVTTSDGTTISLANLGIRESTVDTGDDDSTPGQLTFDNGSTDTLVSMLQTNPQQVQDLFTMQSNSPYVINDTATVTTANGTTENRQTFRKNSEGLAYRLQDIINDYTTTGSTSSVQGQLISLLGSSSDGNQLNSIYDQITDMNSQITALNTKMTDKKNALYAKFSTLESFMAKMNSQSGVLASLSSSSGS
ncbi:MAG: flagellar filament capping protein FliD [Ethanoligenens sp.]|uniref:flagellar filament capping protein FliD n=1 Tax=Ethanoligenens sp. TaxID=2099655 RepID=UPI0039E91C00